MPSFPYLIITDANRRQFEGAASQAGPTGYLGWQHPEAPRVFRGPKPVANLIPRSQWTSRIQAGAAYGTFLSDLVKQRGIKAKDQGGQLKYCWVYGSTRAAELWRILGGKSWLDLSPESVGGPCTRWRNQGGCASEAFDQLENFGACEASYVNAPWSLQPRLWKPGWQANALTHEVPDWYDIETGDNLPAGATCFDEVISCLLNRVPVACGLDWWGHLVCFLDPVILPPGTAPANTPDGATVGVVFQNSWGVDWPTPGANGLACLTEDLATPDGAAAPVANGLPSWS